MELKKYSGWYFICFKDELKIKSIKTIKIYDKELIVFVNSTGEISVMSAFCPHLGAHLGHGGRIENDLVICPFHGFRFNKEGVCVETGYGDQPQKKSCINTYPVFVDEDMVYMYFTGKNNQEIIPTPNRFRNDSITNYSTKLTTSWIVKAHLIDITENTADIGHLQHVHNYDSVSILSKPKIDNNILEATYQIIRTAGFLGRKKSIETDFNVKMFGPGMAIVKMDVRPFGMKMHNYVLSTPIDDTTVRLSIILTFNNDLNPSKFSRIFGLLPRFFSTKIIQWSVFKGFKDDVELDFPIWANKKYLEKPALASGDGPINLVRKYAERFRINEVINQEINKSIIFELEA